MKRILVMDDDPDITMVLSHIFQLYGYSVETLTDADFFLDTVVSNPPALIFLDINLGTQDGRRLCRTIKQSPHLKSIPIIMISASPVLKQVLQQDGGPDSILEKPFDIDHLINMTNKYIAA
jgi:CheY-like chemotaxis protein